MTNSKTKTKKKPIELDRTDPVQLKKIMESDNIQHPMFDTPLNQLHIKDVLKIIKENPSMREGIDLDNEMLDAFERIFNVSDLGERKHMVDMMMEHQLKASQQYKDTNDSKTIIGALIFIKALYYQLFEIPFDDLAKEMQEMFPSKKQNKENKEQEK